MTIQIKLSDFPFDTRSIRHNAGAVKALGNGATQIRTNGLVYTLTKNTLTIEKPEYYHLKEGELIQEGDEVEISSKWNDPAKWVKVEAGHKTIGTPAPNPRFISHRKYRRLITK